MKGAPNRGPLKISMMIHYRLSRRLGSAYTSYGYMCMEMGI